MVLQSVLYMLISKTASAQVNRINKIFQYHVSENTL